MNSIFFCHRDVTGFIDPCLEHCEGEAIYPLNYLMSLVFYLYLPPVSYGSIFSLSHSSE
jgi:hypothetical protein